WPRPTTGWRWRPSTAPSPRCPAPTRRSFGNRCRRRFIAGAGPEMIEIDLDRTAVRELNDRLHRLPKETNERDWRLVNPKGRHAIAVGIDLPIAITIEGHVGFYCAGMNKQAEVVIGGHAGPGVAENMMSGCVRVRGNASQSAGASARGGLLVIEGDTSSRCGISMKGADIVVGGSVGHMSAFMAQRGNLVVCGDAGRSLGDSI